MQAVDKALNDIVRQYSRLLGDNLVGIYLHGSLAMGCYNPDSSDVDFLVVVKSDLPFRLKRELIAVLLKLSEEGPITDFEMSVMLESHARKIMYPTPFLFHYSNAHKESYMNDAQYICGEGVDEDLAAHITILNHRGKCLVGKPIDQVFGDVPTQYYIDSIVKDIEFAKSHIVDMPVYMTLNLCRVYYYLREGVICSKQEGGEWGLKTVSSKYQNLIMKSLQLYAGSIKTSDWDQQELLDYSLYMENVIKKLHRKNKVIGV